MLSVPHVSAQQFTPGHRGMTDTSTFREQLRNASTDEQKLRVYRQFSTPRYNLAIDTVLAMAKEVNALNFSPGVQAANYHYIKGHAFSRVSPDSSIYHYSRAVHYFKDQNMQELYLSSISLLSSEMLLSGRILSAEEIILDAIAYAKENDVPERNLRSFYSQAAAIYARTMAHDQAIYMSERILEFQNDELTQCNTKQHIATSLYEMERYSEAREKLQSCVNSETLDIQLAAGLNLRMSEIYLAKNDTTESLYWLEQGVERAKTSGNLNLESSMLARKGTLLIDSGEIEKATQVSTRLSEGVFERIAPHAMIWRKVYLALYHYSVENYDDSLANAETAIQFAERFNLENELGSLYDTRASVYEAQGDMEKALTETRRQIGLNESIAAARSEREEASARIRYELRMNEASLSSALQRQQSATTRFWFTLIFSVGLVFGLAYIYRRYQISQASVEDISEKLTQAEAEHEKLQKYIEERNRKWESEREKETKALTDEDKLAKSSGNSIERAEPEFVEFNKKMKLACDSISYVQADGNYVKIYKANGNDNGKQTHFLERMSLKKAMEILPPNVFVRLHRSTVANINHIELIKSDSVVLRNGTELQMSRRYKKELADSLPVV